MSLIMKHFALRITQFILLTTLFFSLRSAGAENFEIDPKFRLFKHNGFVGDAPGQNHAGTIGDIVELPDGKFLVAIVQRRRIPSKLRLATQKIYN